MTSAQSESGERDRLEELLCSELDPVIAERLRRVREASGLSCREIISQAVDLAWHVQMSGELDYRAPDVCDAGA